MPLSVVSITTAANKLERPFTVVPLVTVGDLSVSLFVCQGQINWHRHLDEDELFLIHEGVVTLDTERGRMTLHSEELAVVPKGVGHRSGSQLRSVVMLMRPAVLSERKNGHRQHVTDTDPPIEKVRLARVQATLPAPFQALTVAQVEDFELLLLSAQGRGPAAVAPGYGALWIALRGSLAVELDGGDGVTLEAGELSVVPPSTAYRLAATAPSIALTLARSSGPAN